MSRKYRPQRAPRVRRARPLLVAVGAVMLTAGCNETLHGVAACGPGCRPQQPSGDMSIDMNVGPQGIVPYNPDGGK